MLDPVHARSRQQRLLAHMQTRRLDAVVIGWRWHVAYFTTHIPFWLQEAAVVFFADGRTVLIAAKDSAVRFTTDEVFFYDANWLGTQRETQPALVAEQVVAQLRQRGARTIGVDTSQVSAAVCQRVDSLCASVDDELLRMRRRKDSDEIALIRKAISCCGAMYGHARHLIEPGIPELRVFGELNSVAVDIAGEPLSAHLGNDFACGTMGGPPRKAHAAEAGQIYILDLGPAYRGYFSDASRCFCVDRKPTDVQLRAWESLLGIFPLVERMARPGVRCRDLFAAAEAHLRDTHGAAMVHHLGHGIGLTPHEFPHLNPRYDDVLAEGDVFTCEPGIYNEQLNAGLRLENLYLVTAGGVENMTPFPMELA
jgi:Xaa-Pro aminopeptidase